VQRDCPNHRVLVVKDDGGYSSASDLDEATLVLLAADDAGTKEPPEEQIGVDDAEHSESLIVQRVLSAQMEKAEQNQRHNLASSDMVEKLGLTTKPHPIHITFNGLTIVVRSR
jgi:hypothetical protein